MPGAKWLEMLLQHVPDRGEHLVRYCGWVSQDRSSSERTQPGERTDKDVRAGGRDCTVAPPRKATPQLFDWTPYALAAWARLIKKIYEADPLICPHCGGEMRFLSVIEEPVVIEHILRHLRLWDPRPPGQAPPDDDDWPITGQIPLTYEHLPAIA